MGEAILQGLKLNPKNGNGDTRWELLASVRSEASAQRAHQEFGITCLSDNLELARRSEVILLCVKPYQAEAILKAITPTLTDDKLLISICASITLKQLREWSGGKIAVIRAMPNTPCLVRAGMTVFCAENSLSPEKNQIAEAVFSTLGKTAALMDEALMDGATGLSGCGPAYAYLIIEALSDAGVKVGLPRALATELAAQTLAGSAKMVMERRQHPAALKDEVTTPSGCTIDGLMALEEGGLRVTLIKAVVAAAERSRELRRTSE